MQRKLGAGAGFLTRHKWMFHQIAMRERERESEKSTENGRKMKAV